MSRFHINQLSGLIYVFNCMCSQSPGGGSKPQTVSNTCAVLEQVLPSTTSSANKSALDTEMIEFIDCEWSEHVCPDGYLYYYNCETCESRVRIYFFYYRV